MQSRDLVEAHRLVFSAKLYDHQGPIARGGSYQPPPPDRPRYEKCPDRARVKLANECGFLAPTVDWWRTLSSRELSASTPFYFGFDICGV